MRAMQCLTGVVMIASAPAVTEKWPMLDVVSLVVSAGVVIWVYYMSRNDVRKEAVKAALRVAAKELMDKTQQDNERRITNCEHADGSLYKQNDEIEQRLSLKIDDHQKHVDTRLDGLTTMIVNAIKGQRRN